MATGATGVAEGHAAPVSDDRPAFLSLFAGVGGFDRALELAGFRCAGQVEIDRFGRKILRERFPHARLWRDVRRFRGTQAGRLVQALRADEPQGRADVPRDRDSAAGDGRVHRAAGRIDLLVGGFPCQDLSVAGKRAGLGGSRSGLFYEIIRIAKILRPTWGIFENVPGLL
ncbi:MAG: DNA cytosine methyltransferase, partial [Patescibacteria group bacterium]